MKTCLFAILLFFGWSGLAQEESPRNPFWPQDFEGFRYPITLKPRFKPQPKEAPVVKKVRRAVHPNAPGNPSVTNALTQAAVKAAEEKKRLEEKMWTDARRALDFGSSISFSSTKQSTAAVTINGYSYCVGDLVSKNVGDNRFTWSVEEISKDGKLKLKRLKYRSLKKNENEKK